MNYLLIHMHWNNRGDEAANLALINHIKSNDNNYNIYIQPLSRNRDDFDLIIDEHTHIIEGAFPRKRNAIEFAIMYLSKGYICWSDGAKNLLRAIRNADYVVHCPGGPSIGDIYEKWENQYIKRLLLIAALGKKYIFYAPSAGPFLNEKKFKLRKRVYENSSNIVFREAISGGYYETLQCDKEYSIAVDTAFLGDDGYDGTCVLNENTELKDFFKTHSRVVGITITDLMWNPKYENNEEIRNRIEDTFEKFLPILISKGYGIIFIPQLFGEQNDLEYMHNFKTEHSMVLSDTHDCFFQQYIISKLYAVIGMRYHSNIFSCKMKTPFISISYEQKMRGFMQNAGLEKWCIDVEEISPEAMEILFERLEEDYIDYANNIISVSDNMRRVADDTFKNIFGVERL